MNKKPERTLWVSSVQPRQIDGSPSIPTSLYYGNEDNPEFGWRAAERRDGYVVNENFKLELGEISPGSIHRKIFETAGGKEITAMKLARDFFDAILHDIEKEFPKVDTKIEGQINYLAKIIVAEPLNFQIETQKINWLSNYRENIRRILHRYAKVEFLPEPFAVYQYYRYGLRIPHLQENARHVALIVDFGGGTFDICIVQSTAKGDVSLSGKHSKPLSADSAPIGGFFINSAIAEYLIKQRLEGPDRRKADQCIKAYRRLKKGELLYDQIGEEKKIFANNLRNLEIKVERAKIELVSKIMNWSLDGDSYEKVLVDVPRNPFSESEWISAEFFAHQFRRTFLEEVWNKNIRRVVARVIRRANESLINSPISITLMSGGSSNIRWLSRLISSEFSDELGGAVPVPISESFQEIVANGLAIECARRFYNEDESSEFVAVTYNPIKLHLDPDGKGILKDRTFVSVNDKIDMRGARRGDLMPSAQSLRNFIDQPLQWKVKLPHPPRRQMNYYFIRPDDPMENPEEISRYNVEQESTRVITSKGTSFDSRIKVELTVKSDGTVTPKFIYKEQNLDHGIEGAHETGRPFALDMTTGENSSTSTEDYFVGLDFGTSTSSICTLNRQDVALTQSRQEDSAWTRLGEALPRLPYPISLPLRHYLDVRNASDPANNAREAFEACMGFIAYCTASEVGATEKLGDLLSSFAHRSMGPLKQLLERSLDERKNTGSAIFSSPYRELRTQLHWEWLGTAVREFTDHKHEKLESCHLDHHRHLAFIVNHVLAGMKNKYFGFCLTSEPMPFQSERYHGIFKVAHDNAPFIESFKYSSNTIIPKERALLIDTNTGKGLDLFPFFFWVEQNTVQGATQCFILDKFIDNKDDPLIKPCDSKSVCNTSAIDIHLAEAIRNSIDLVSRSKVYEIYIEDEEH